MYSKLLLFGLLPGITSTAVLTSSQRAPTVPAAPAASRVPVVVELFTSEGCSSCPAADAALRELETAQSVPGVEVLALGEHVDYWNRLGWKDIFSTPQFTERQRRYAAVFKEGSYTPQAVVNGRYELVGSQRGTLAQRVAQAALLPHATVQISRAEAGMLRVQVNNLPADTKGAEVLLALTETGLASQIGRGENAGSLLRHAAVVRSLRSLGAVGNDGQFLITAPLSLNPQWKTAHLRAVVLVQEAISRRIVGAGSLAVEPAG